MDDTIFDRILRKEIPAHVVYENEHVLSIKDINPQAPVHVLVIPKKKLESVRDFAAADPVDLGNFLAGVSLTASALNLDKDGYRVVFNTGRHALQTVSYVHAHILGGKSLGGQLG